MRRQNIPLHAPLYQVVPQRTSSSGAASPRSDRTPPAPASLARPLPTAASGSGPDGSAAPRAANAAGFAGVADSAAAPLTGSVPASAPGKNPVAEQLLETIADSVAELAQHQRQLLREMQHVAVELGVAVAARIAYEKLEQDQFAIEQLVAEMLHEFEPAERLTVRLHPADLAVLQQRISTLPPVERGEQHVEYCADGNLTRGSCRVDSESYGLVTDMATRVDILRHRLLEGVEHAQVERRQTAAGNSGLQRFPDRRETA